MTTFYHESLLLFALIFPAFPQFVIYPGSKVYYVPGYSMMTLQQIYQEAICLVVSL